MTPLDKDTRKHAVLMCAYAMHALSTTESFSIENHIAACEQCQAELKKFRSAIASFASWPTDLLRPSAWVQVQLACRIAMEPGRDAVVPATREWFEPEWEEVVPGIFCRLLATDIEKNIVSMLVRLAPGTDYPPHVHADVEELYMLDGELWIDGKKLYAGDYNRAAAGTGDQRVWSETGCTCVLITSTRDKLR
jgi:anti-sigma factor ChrR (cupin superfamily)